MGLFDNHHETATPADIAHTLELLHNTAATPVHDLMTGVKAYRSNNTHGRLQIIRGTKLNQQCGYT